MRVLLAGGGTAGHINPALAIASVIKRALSGYGIFICRNAKWNGSKTYSGSGL